MAAAIAVIRKFNQRKIAKEDTGDENLLLDLVTKLPLKELWVEEHILGILVLG